MMATQTGENTQLTDEAGTQVQTLHAYCGDT